MLNISQMRSFLLAIILALLSYLPARGQVRVDSSFSFQLNPSKGYSIYVPSAYDPNTPNGLMLGMHPLNPSRWNSISWCDTLIDFAEMNNLLLVCPDGGPNGSVVDQIDTAFTTALLDSMYKWYNIDTERQYIMGFSFGGRGTYTYGLSHPEVFGGLIPIGAAINGTSQVNGPLQANAACKAVYIVHGSNDSPNNRYYPVRTALLNSGAILNSLLMPGVGHTIDFPNRNQILTTAFQWIDSVNQNTTVPVANFTFMNSGSSVTFADNSSSATSWFWDFGDGDTATIASPVHSYATSGTFNACLTVSNAAGCSSTFCDSVTVIITNVSESLFGAYSLYPNPVHSSTTLTWEQGAGSPRHLQLLDLNGKVLQNISLAAGQMKVKIPLETYSEGSYLLRIHSAKGHAFTKVLVKK